MAVGHPPTDPHGDARAAFLAALEYGVSPVVAGPILDRGTDEDVRPRS